MRFLIALLLTVLVSNIGYSAELFASVDAYYGKATVTDSNGQSMAVSLGLKINEGQTIRTAPDGEVHLVTQDGGMIALRPNTEFRVDEYKAEGGADDRIFMTLIKGTLRSITGWIGKHNPASYSLTTYNATIGIRGTDHETTVITQEGGDEPGTYDRVIEGATVLKTANGATNVSPGNFAFAPQGKREAPYLLARIPKYWTTRNLKIEDRIQQRKEFLRDHMERMREDRNKQLSSDNAAHPERSHERHGHTHRIDHKP